MNVPSQTNLSSGNSILKRAGFKTRFVYPHETGLLYSDGTTASAVVVRDFSSTAGNSINKYEHASELFFTTKEKPFVPLRWQKHKGQKIRTFYML